MPETYKRATIKNPAFWVCLTITIGLFVAGFCVPPHGEIDGSLLTAGGILFAFATLETVHVALRKGVDAKVKHGQTELMVGDLDKDQEKQDNYEESE
ncbi:MAG: hypothetical protein J6Y87_07085 [Muribaculaceae bacterium]|nr:hypothetical protein [Muribaculaceae bacterium]